MEIVEIPLDKLASFEGNPRLRTEKVLGHLVKSIREFGFVDPVIVWANATKYGYPKNCILGGHRRVDALRWLVENEGMKAPLVPCVKVKVAGEHKAKALNIALNRVGEEFDMPALKDWLVEVDTGDFDIEVTGFTSEDLEGFVGREPVEVDGTEYNVSRLEHVKCPACGHEWDA
jgi:ParB-like chromosome segregation protein Spo0J